MSLLRLALLSAWARRFTLSVTVMAVALATCLLLLMERVRQDTRNGFMQAVSGVDLVVGGPAAAGSLWCCNRCSMWAACPTPCPGRPTKN
jgi:hypothetical protein